MGLSTKYCFADTAEALEKKELQPFGGRLTGSEYSKLLVIYLCQGDLISAKFLWKRIPIYIKNNYPELPLIWIVGKGLWRHDSAAVHTAIDNTKWSESINPYIKYLSKNLREETFEDVSKSYRSISINSLSTRLGLTLQKVKEAVKERNWNVSGDYVYPIKSIERYATVTTTEEQLQILTDFVLFLEN